METSEIAVRALEILDRDGWCRGTFTRLVGPEVINLATGVSVRRFEEYRAGSHCGGGIWSLACGFDTWAEEGFFVPLWEKICEVFPEQAERAENFFDGVVVGGPQVGFMYTALAKTVRWNDHFASEADVRIVFEKLAAG